jgi:rhomboid protease GluP
VSRSAPSCPYCGLSRPGSVFKNNPLSRLVSDEEALFSLILGANITMFVLSLLVAPRGGALSPSPFVFLSPSSESLFVLGASGSMPVFAAGRWWTLISANYLHGGLLHIVFNMVALYNLAPLLIKEYGASRMVAIYTLSGIISFLVSAVAGVPLTIGASGAVCGLIGAALYFGKSRGGTYGRVVFSQLGSWMVGIFLFGFLVPGINNWGHGGGLVAGALVGYLLGYRERRQERFSHRLLAVTCLVITGLALGWSVVNAVGYLLL